MASIISAGTTSGTALNMAGDTSGVLQLATNGSTTALTIDASQRAAFVAGTAALPAITTTGDTNTGMFFPAADTIAFAEGGTEAMRLDSSGNVGIGTTSPIYKLEVSGNIAARFANPNVSAILVQATTGTNAAAMTFNNTAGNFFVGKDSSDGSRISGTAYANCVWGETAYPTVFGTNNVDRMRISETGSLILVGSTAQKATGTTWSNPSDQRLKDNIRDYTKGTTELMQVRVREWEYNGKGGTTEGLKGLGVVADEVMTVLPNTVETYDVKLNADDEETTEIKKFDATEITWLLVKTVQEQQTIINDLKARITALEGAA